MYITFPHKDLVGKDVCLYTVDSELLQCLEEIDSIVQCIGWL